ncbi:hypothetical protein M0R79_06255 [Ignavigranum ruoffiae]|uniref:hypothetical protein n=1 Tax=Ignavigranum ruoffiae TaxID=89093 RepID=UPI002052155F|nr:hypothetical protein [Ignavigranum ruoffiae]UPQ85256.1 hypothetical protein M0R79_06255 [Ignavigranum ruoffiae]
MEDHILYYSDLCPDTEEFVSALQAKEIVYQAVNITESMANLKAFLKLRDKHPDFKAIKEQGKVGVPVLFSAQKLYFNQQEL